MRICFYAAVPDERLFDTVEFYRQDIRALEQLGNDVRLVNRPSGLSRGDDLYWVWWPTSGLPAVIWAASQRRPRVLVSAYSDRDRTPSGAPGKTRISRAAVHVSVALASRVLATSEDTRQGLARYLCRDLRSDPLGVDTDYYRSDGVMRAEDAPFVLTISQLTEDNVARKRVLDVVRAAELTRESLPDLRFLIAGRLADGAPRVRAAIVAAGLEERVLLLGSVPAEEKRRLLSAAALYVQPSDYEAFGMAVAEAMACETVVVSHSVGNLPDLVGDTGRLLPAGAGADELAREIIALLSEDGRAQLGRRARQRIVQRFSFDRRRRSIADVLSELGVS